MSIYLSLLFPKTLPALKRSNDEKRQKVQKQQNKPVNGQKYQNPLLQDFRYFQCSPHTVLSNSANGGAVGLIIRETAVSGGLSSLRSWKTLCTGMCGWCEGLAFS